MKLRDIAAASRMMGGGGPSGPVSWNDLTDKPFYEETKDVTLLENFTSAEYEANG
jgi:hypothetical protein